MMSLLVHDVGLTAQVGQARHKYQYDERGRHGILFNWRLRTSIDRGSVDCVNSKFLLV